MVNAKWEGVPEVEYEDVTIIRSRIYGDRQIEFKHQLYWTSDGTERATTQVYERTMGTVTRTLRHNIEWRNEDPLGDYLEQIRMPLKPQEVKALREAIAKGQRGAARKLPPRP